MAATALRKLMEVVGPYGSKTLFERADGVLVDTRRMHRSGEVVEMQRFAPRHKVRLLGIYDAGAAHVAKVVAEREAQEAAQRAAQETLEIEREMRRAIRRQATEQPVEPVLGAMHRKDRPSVVPPAIVRACAEAMAVEPEPTPAA